MFVRDKLGYNIVLWQWLCMISLMYLNMGNIYQSPAIFFSCLLSYILMVLYANPETMAFDDVLWQYVGEMGRSQILVIVMISICLIPDSVDVMEIVYIQATPSSIPRGELWLINTNIHHQN